MHTFMSFQELQQMRNMTSWPDLTTQRELKSWTQRHLGKELETSHATISAWERGERVPGRADWEALRVIFPGLKPPPGYDTYMQPIPEAAPVLANRRADIPAYRAARKGGKGQAVPQWLNLAAGGGVDLELAPELIHIETNEKNIHAAVIRKDGDSMRNTLLPGDVVLLKEIHGGRFPLPQIEDATEKIPLAKWKTDSGIRDGDIVVVSINDNAPTIKRVVYDTERGERDWKLQIVADNPPAWRGGKTFQVAVGDSVVFHAKLIGRGEFSIDSKTTKG